MGAFIGYGEVGVWANNGERDSFLDWFAAHRCEEGDARWEYCKSGDQRWSGRGIDLEDLIPKGQVLEISSGEYDQAAAEYCPDFARLLGIIESITRSEWCLRVNMRASNDWRRDYWNQIACSDKPQENKPSAFEDYVRFQISRAATAELYTGISAVVLFPFAVIAFFSLAVIDLQLWQLVAAYVVAGVWSTITISHAGIYFARRNAWY